MPVINVSIDTDKEVCVVSFFIPRDRKRDEIRFLKGRVLMSGQRGVLVGDSVVATSGALEIILDEEPGIPLVIYIVPNNRYMGNEEESKWFAGRVEPTPPSTNEAAKALIASAVESLTTASKLI